jgi:hypothetical protein
MDGRIPRKRQNKFSDNATYHSRRSPSTAVAEPAGDVFEYAAAASARRLTQGFRGVSGAAVGVGAERARRGAKKNV